MARGGPVINVTITADDQTGKGINSATAKVDGFGSRVSGFAVGAGAALTTFAVNAVPQLIGVASEMVALGRTTEINMAKADTVFGDSAPAVKRWADDVNESMGLSDEAVVGLAASMGDLLVPLGMSREAAASMTQDTIGAAGALSAWSGGAYDAADVSEILTKAYLGETDGLKALGVSISADEVARKAQAIAAAEGRDEITAMDKALATQQLVMEKSADAQTAWADGTMDAVKEQNEMSAAIADAKEEIGRGLLPIVQAATSFIVQTLIPTVRNVIATFREKWPEIREAVEPVMEWFRTTIADVLEVIGAAWDLFGSRIMTQVGNAFDYIREAISSAMQVIAGVIDLVLGVLTGDWSRAWDGIKSIVKGVWDGITNLIRYALRTVGLLLDIAWENVKGAVRNAWSAVTSTVSNAISDVVGYVTGLPGRIVGTVSSVWDGLKSGATIAKDWIGNRIDDVVSFVAGIPGRVATAVTGAFGAIPRAFRSAINGIIDAWNGLSFRIRGGPWDPLGAFGPEIPAVNFGFDTPNIRRLAAGGLAFGPTLAIVGDNVGARNDPEVIAPLSKLTAMMMGAEIGMPGAGAGNGRGGTVINNWPVGVRPDDTVNAGRTYDRIQGTRS